MNSIISAMRKAKDYSQLVPEKKTTTDGVTRTYWVSPEDRNQGKNAGQVDLFHEKDTKQHIQPKDGYFERLDKDSDEYQIKPLISKFNTYDPALAKRIELKYSNYIFDRDTKEKDIEADFQTAWFLQKMKNNPGEARELQEEYNEKTDKMVKIISNRKNKMLKIKKGFEVMYGETKGKVSGFSKRGFPIVLLVNGESRPFLHEELKYE